MFFECRVLNPKGKLLRVISAKEVKKIHWKNFAKQEEERRNPRNYAKKPSSISHPDFVLIDWEIERLEGL